jgi:hypothetical protein
LKHNYSATAAPTVTDDASDGYAVGSQWFDITNDRMYACIDATIGAADWDDFGGDVVGPGAVNDRAVCIFDGTTGKLIRQTTTPILLSASGTTIYGLKTFAQGAAPYATLFGITDPTGAIDYWVQFSAAGPGGTPELSAAATGANSDIRIKAKGSGTIDLDAQVYIGKITPTDELFFRDTGCYIHSDQDGSLTLRGDLQTVVGVPGDIVLGDSTERDMYPQTTLKINLGKSAAWFNEGYIDKLHVGWAEDNVSSPPTDAELDTAFGTPAAVGDNDKGGVICHYRRKLSK